MALRISMGIVLFLSVLYMPIWVTLLLTFVGMIFFSYFWEGPAILLLSDLLFGARETRYFGIYFVSLLLGGLMLFGIETFKTKSIFYNNRSK